MYVADKQGETAPSIRQWQRKCMRLAVACEFAGNPIARFSACEAEGLLRSQVHDIGGDKSSRCTRPSCDGHWQLLGRRIAAANTRNHLRRFLSGHCENNPGTVVTCPGEGPRSVDCGTLRILGMLIAVVISEEEKSAVARE